MLRRLGERRRQVPRVQRGELREVGLAPVAVPGGGLAGPRRTRRAGSGTPSRPAAGTHSSASRSSSSVMSSVAISALVASAISASRPCARSASACARSASARACSAIARASSASCRAACSAAKAASRSCSTRTRSVTSVCTPTKLTSSPLAVEDRADRQLVPEGGAVLAVVQQRRGAPCAAPASAGADLGDRGGIGRRALEEAAVAADDLLGARSR